MQFLIADTFTASLARLSGDEQKAVKTTAFDLQVDPTGAGMSVHKLDKVKDKNFWSVRASSDIRIITHRTPGSLMLCYVDHHDKAYAWAEKRKLETHPTTGAAQLVEIRETVHEIAVPVYVESPQFLLPKQLFAEIADSKLLSYGVPVEWLADVRAATDTSYLGLIDHLPAEAAEALLEIATGGIPTPVVKVNSRATFDMSGDVNRSFSLLSFDSKAPKVEPFEHPDAKRRFRVMNNVEELQRALDAPWEKWSVFLHPDQRSLVERNYNGPARVSGSAGTGKTVVALHRAVFLAKANPDSRVLLGTFSDVLANALRHKLFALVSNQPKLAERIDVCSLDSIGRRLYQPEFGPPNFVPEAALADMLVAEAEKVAPGKFSRHFLMDEWQQIVDARQLTNWEEYRDVPRLGRKTRLPETQRALLWAAFEQVGAALQKAGLITPAMMFHRVAESLPSRRNPPFDFAVVDEAQDINIGQLRFLAALGGGRRNALFFAGDLGQRIFQLPFSWLSMGVDVRGRCRTLRVNYRTSHQIRTETDRLLAPEVADVDGNIEKRKGTISVFNGPSPAIQVAADNESEIDTVSTWLAEQAMAGVQPHECAVFVRSSDEIERARSAVERAGLPYKILDDEVELTSGRVSLGTMHLAKGLEFRSVAVMACDDEVVPLASRIEAAADESDLQEVYDTERHLLYVACTRARDRLLVTGVAPASEFLDDLT